MKTVLAIVNDPKGSESFIKYCANLAKDLKAGVHIVYIQTPENYPMGGPGTTGASVEFAQVNYQEIQEEIEKMIKKHIAEVKSSMTGEVSIDFSFKIGVFRTVVDEIVDEDKVAYVAIEGHEEGSFWEQNPTNMDIIRNVDSPVWVIPEEASYEPFQNIVYATDYNEEDVSTMKKLIKITRGFDPELSALHISSSKDFQAKVKEQGFNDLVQEKTGYGKINVDTLTEDDESNFAELLNDYAVKTDANLIAVLKENKNFLERLFKSSSTKKIIKKAKVPVLVFHEKD